MKLLITMKLLDKNLQYHISPLSKVDCVDEIYIVRDKPGPKIDKVIYYSVPAYLRWFSPFSILYKQFLMIYLAFVKRPRFILGYLFFPHGLLALLSGIISKKITGVFLLAGPVEVYSPGTSPVKKYAYTSQMPPLSNLNKILIKILCKFHTIFVAGSFTKKFLIDCGIPEKSIVTIPYIVTDSGCNPYGSEKRYDLISIGRLAPIKHIEISLMIIRKLVFEYGLKNLKLCVIGNGPCEKDLKNYCQKLGISNNVEFLGFQQEIAPFYNSAKLLIINSERETGPLTAIESLMCGVPIVTSRCGDMIIDFVISDYNSDVIEDYRDVELYAKKIFQLLHDPKKYQMYSENALKIHDNLNERTIIQQWNNFFKQLCN